jgi:cytochrome c oxidase assembly factor CtaG
MTLLAHAGHWLAQVAYALPIVLVIIALVVSKLRERRARANDGEPPVPERAA